MATMALRGGEKLERKLAEIARKVARGATLRVGFLEGATYPDGTSVAAIAAIQNFGAPAVGIPARPFFTNFIKNNVDEWGEKLARILVSVEYDATKALNLMGMGMAGQLRQSIIETNAPALSKVTLLLRERFPTRDGMTPDDVWQAFSDIAAGVEPSGNGKPLVWSGQLLNSVDHEVTDHG